jgi:hypothetical protein
MAANLADRIVDLKIYSIRGLGPLGWAIGLLGHDAPAIQGRLAA